MKKLTLPSDVFNRVIAFFIALFCLYLFLINISHYGINPPMSVAFVGMLALLYSMYSKALVNTQNDIGISHTILRFILYTENISGTKPTSFFVRSSSKRKHNVILILDKGKQLPLCPGVSKKVSRKLALELKIFFQLAELDPPH
mgnify:FL=1